MIINFILFLSRERFDAVHINPSLNHFSLLRDGLILLVLKLYGYKNILIWFHGWDSVVEKTLKHNLLLRSLFVRIFGSAFRIVVLAPEFFQALEEMGIKSRSLLYATTLFDGKEVPKNIAPSEERMILFLSRFDTRKGAHELLAAFANIAGDFPDAKLVLAGDGEENGRLREMVKKSGVEDRVSFPGYVSGGEKAALLARCEVFALPTYYPEGMPIALLEAMACGKPLLTSKAGGIKHIVHEPDNGIVLDKVTMESVEAGLRRLLSDADYCEKTGRRNAEYAWKHFEAKVVAAKIESLYAAMDFPD